MRRLILAIALLTVGVTPARAQSAWSADLALGGGRVHGGEFRRDVGEQMIAGRLDWRVARVAGVELLVGLTSEQPFGDLAVTAVCIPGSHGQCLREPPEVRAITAAIGLRRAIAGRIAFGVSGGPGKVFDNRWGSSQSAFGGQCDVALRLFGPVYITGAGRVIAWHSGGASLHSYTQLYGIRLN